jgi:nucleoside-diphosphate-sugar epimerase
MILVTGGTGLVGSHLIYNLLSKGHSVKAFVRPTSNKNNILRTISYYSESPQELYNKIIWAEGDILNPVSIDDALQDIKKVYHTAAHISFNPREKKKVFHTNVFGTANIVNCCLNNNIEKLCFVSSIGALGQNEDGSPIHEEVYWKPSKYDSVYSISKYQSEMEVWRGITEGLNAIIVNPSVILGPGNWSKGSPAFFHFGNKGLPFYAPGTTGFVDVRDLVELMTILMENNFSGERFIISNENIPYIEFFTKISEALHKRPPKYKVNSFVLAWIYWIEYLKSFLFNTEPQITKELIDISQKELLYSSEKLKRSVNFAFTPFGQTISDIAQLYLKEKSTGLKS